MQDSRHPVVACANGWLFRSSVPAFLLRKDKLTIEDTVFSLKTAVPQAIHQGCHSVYKDTIRQMPLVLGGANMEMEAVVYTGRRSVTLEVSSSDKPHAEITVPLEFRDQFRCCLDDSGKLYISAGRPQAHGCGDATYQGDHIDLRDTVTNGPVIGKVVIYEDGHHNTVLPMAGRLQETIRLTVPYGTELMRYDAHPSDFQVVGSTSLRLIN
jgi:hypothetical protein